MIPRSGSKKTFFSVMTVLLVLFLLSGICEITSYFILFVKQANFYLSPDFTPEIQKKLAQSFSYELGWEPQWPNEFGYRGDHKDIDDALICLFGDSFTEGHPDIKMTWAHVLEKKLKKPVLNFGVSAYGTDQAYLRFEKRYGGRIKTPYVCLGVMSENIARVVNRFRVFYSRKNDRHLTKPMYSRENHGTIILLPNPIKSPDEIPLLNDMGFLKKIGQKDYWYQHYEKYGLNRKVHFPYSYFFLKALPYYVENYYKKRIKNYSDYKILYEKDFAKEVLEYVIFKFISRAKERETAPVILFLPNWKDIVDYQRDGKTVYGKFCFHVKGLHDATFDALDYFVPYLEQGEDVSDFFISYKSGHYNAHGEQVIADGFYRSLKILCDGSKASTPQ